MNAVINANVVEALGAAGFKVVPRRTLSVLVNSLDHDVENLGPGMKDMDAWLNVVRVSSFLEEGEVSCIGVTTNGNPILALHWAGGTISVHVASLFKDRLVVIHQEVRGGSRLTHDQGHDNSVTFAHKAIAGQPQTIAGFRAVYEAYRGRFVSA